MFPKSQGRVVKTLKRFVQPGEASAIKTREGVTSEAASSRSQYSADLRAVPLMYVEACRFPSTRHAAAASFGSHRPFDEKCILT